jgi:hypothetical protein
VISLAKRKEILAQVPWIKLLKLPVQCEGFMSNTSLKHIYGTKEQLAQKPVCKNRAFWKFTHSKRCEFHNGEVEHFCLNHLFSRGLYGCMYEASRFDKWWNKNKEQCL